MRPPRRFGPFILASAAVHVLALLLVSRIDWAPQPPPRPLAVRLIPLQPGPTPQRPAPARPSEPQAAERRPEEASPRREATTPTQPRPPAREAPTPAPRPSVAVRPTPPAADRQAGQIVDVPSRLRPEERRERPADTRYLSDRDRTVDREMVARARPGTPGTPGEPQPPGEGAARPAPPQAAPPAPPSDAPRAAEPVTPSPPRAVGEAPTPAPAPQVAQGPRPVAPPPAQPAPAEPPRPAPPAARAEASRPPAPVPSVAAPEPRAPQGPATPPGPETQTHVARLEPTPAAPPARPEAPREADPRDTPREALPPSAPSSTSRGARAVPDPDAAPPGDGSRPPDRKLPGLGNLLRDPTQLARNTAPDAARRGEGGAGGSVRDYVPGVEEGEETFLNTREFRYAYYFNQIKRMINDQWRPDALARELGQETGIPYEPISTFLVILAKDGRVAEVTVLRQSGVDAFDREVARTIRRVGQFPAPPAPMLEPDGSFRFRFGAVLDYQQSRVRVYAPDAEDFRRFFADPMGRDRRPARGR